MASTFIFNNRQISLPGAYSTIVSGEMNPARSLDYGKVFIIDTGVLGAGYGGGSGINGELAKGSDAIYTFNNISDFRNFMKGGMFWKMAEALFYPDPSNPAAVGISELVFASAKTTTAATLTFATAGGGTFALNPRDEGTWANGELNEGHLVKGFAYTIEPGVINPAKWIMKLWRGTYTGTAADGLPFGDETELQAPVKLLGESPEFDKVDELIEWAKTDSNLGVLFALDPTSAVVGAGAIVPADIKEGYQVATGGTETYNPSDIDAVLAEVVGLDQNITITDQFGANANSATQRKVITYMNQTAKFQHFLYVGAYGDKASFNQSLTLAEGFNSDRVVCVHGDSGLNSSQSVDGCRWWGVMFTLATVVGRVSGKPPYIPVTNKSVGVDRVKHELSDSEMKQSLKAGLLTIRKNPFLKKFVVLQGVNTLQDNKSLFNSQGQSYSIQFMRIVAQINRELVVNAEIDLLGDENGVNANTLSAGVIKTWTNMYLQSRVATEQADNLILHFQDVTVRRDEDAWFVNYKIRVNNEITKLFFTGFLIR